MPSLREITVGARNSPLSKQQVEEVYHEVRAIDPSIVFRPIYIATTGDLDQRTSLRCLEKTDFFTREIDQMLLKGGCRLAIHSAKDLPDPLPVGLKLAALTRGVDSSDSLVMQDHETFPPHGLVATSSLRREEAVRFLFPEARFVDIRGAIHTRLAQLWSGKVDGLVVAEAALIRLNLTHLNRLKLPGLTAPLQGRLAILIRATDHEMESLLSQVL